MDTRHTDGSTPARTTKSRRALRRLAATAGTTGLIALAAAAYATLRPATAAAAEAAGVPIAAATAASPAPIASLNGSASAAMSANVVEDTVGVLSKTFGPSTRPAAVDGWVSLFGSEPVKSDAVTTADTVAKTDTTAVAPAIDAAAVPAASQAQLGDVVWTPTPAQTSTAATTPADANPLVISGPNAQGKIAITLNRTAEIKTSVPVKRVSIGAPDVADVQPFGPNLILVTAKKAGSTQVIIWDDEERSQSIDVSVEIPLEQLRDMIGKRAPGSNIEVAVANDTIVLSGHAPNLVVAKQLGDIAAAYGKVQNFIEVAGTQTVAVQVQFAEVSRSVTSSLGVDWGFSDGTSVFGSQIGSQGGPFGLATTDGVTNGYHTVPADPLSYDVFFSGRLGQTPFDIFIHALRGNSLLRMLQEPTLTTTSGEEANFLAGGQVAVPVPADNGTIGIEYKEYGVRLKLTPVVLGNGKIRLMVSAESSELDYANGTKIQGATVPGLRTRLVKNTVELAEGQTMSVAGLLDDSVIATKQSLPGLGDIPVLGQLFRSTRYQRKETELVILITPRLSGAMNPDQVPTLPGANWRHPSELEQFAFGDMGGNAEADAVKDWNKPASQRGLRGNETQQRSPSNEPAAQTRAMPPRFFGEHGFTRAPGDDAVTTSARE